MITTQVTHGLWIQSTYPEEGSLHPSLQVSFFTRFFFFVFQKEPHLGAGIAAIIITTSCCSCWRSIIITSYSNNVERLLETDGETWYLCNLLPPVHNKAGLAVESDYQRAACTCRFYSKQVAIVRVNTLSDFLRNLTSLSNLISCVHVNIKTVIVSQATRSWSHAKPQKVFSFYNELIRTFSKN